MVKRGSTNWKPLESDGNFAGEAIPANDIETTGNDLPSPAREQIAQLAYSFWQARGCQGGSPEEDWYRAEQDLQTKPLESKMASSGSA